MSLTSTTSKRAVVIAGPTAAGKSALALALAERLGGVIINADSQQRYRDLPILTARPTPEEMQRVPHVLFADLGPNDSGSAAEWSAKAAAEITAAPGLPIITGGTGLYLRALMEGLSHIPDVPADIRTQARALMDEIGNDAFHKQLVERDPNAARLAPGDTQRNLRAFEVLEATGASLWEWQQQKMPGFAARYFTIIVLPPRDQLTAACDARFVHMMATGAVDEVRELRDAGVPPDAPIMRVLGAQQIAAYLDHRQTLEQAVTLAQTATRQYAKRQSTWFRNQVTPDLILPASGPAAIADALARVQAWNSVDNSSD